MRFLIAGGAPSSDGRDSEFGSHTWHAGWQYRELGGQGPGDSFPRLDSIEVNSFVDEVTQYDGVLCETHAALVLLREWQRRSMPRRVVLALEVASLTSVERVRAWYRDIERFDPWPLLQTAPCVSWLAPSSRQEDALYAAGVPVDRVQRIIFAASSLALLVPDGEGLLDGSRSVETTSVRVSEGTVLFAGNSCRDWRTILGAVELLPEHPCAIVGGSRCNLEKHLKAMHRPWPSQLQHVEFVPPEEFIAMVRSARIVVVPLVSGDSDGGHTTVALAHRMEVPVVCTEGAALADYCEPERTALMVEPGSSERLAAAIRRVWSDEALRGRLVDAAGQVERERGVRFGAALQAAINRASRAL